MTHDAPPARALHEPATRPFAPGTAVVTVCIIALVTITAYEAMALSAIMPRIASDLQSIRTYGIAFSALLTAQLVGIVLAGVWSERHGPVPGLTFGQLLLAAGSLLCAVAPNFGAFVGGRVLAGFGGGILLVMLYVVVGRAYAESARPKVFTLISAAWIVPSLLGAPVAAWITEQHGWRAVFWVLVPPILITGGLIYLKTAKESDRLAALDAARDHAEHVRAAWAGLGIAVAAGLLQWGSTELHRGAVGHALAAGLGLLGIVIIAPRLLPAGTWRMQRGMPAVLAGRALMTAAFFGSLTYAPLLLVRERHLGLAAAGLLVSVGSLGWALGSFLQGMEQFSGRRHLLISTGGGLLAVSLATMALITATGLPTWLFILPFAVGGTGMGMAVASQSVLALDTTPHREHGLVSSSLMLSDVLGSVVGIAVAGAFFALDHVRHASDAPTYATIWGVLSVVAALVIVSGQRIVARTPAA